MLKDNKDMKINSIAIAGAGTMGAGIAQVCAQSDHEVILFDISRDMLQRAEQGIKASLKKLSDSGKISAEKAVAVLEKIKYVSQVEEVKADLIIEAIVERLEVKTELFTTLMKINGIGTIYATNTSSIPITRIAAQLEFPGQVVGIHFFNPAQIMKLVEIIKGAKTDTEVMKVVYDFVVKIKKEPVIAADSPGFIVNRVARLYYVEALKILEEGVADIEGIDGLMEASGFKMGPFRLMDLIGVDTNYSVTESQYQLFSYEPRFRPSRIQKQKVDAGLHGRKSKEGFYKYE